jgi:hypothetical protein
VAVLRTISHTHANLQLVFEAQVARALRLCDADFASIYR